MPLLFWKLAPYLLAVSVALGALGVAYQRGRAVEIAKAEIARLKDDLAAAATAVSRYEAEARETEAQRAAEAIAAAEAERALTDRITSLQTDQDIADAAGLALEQELVKLETDKDKLNALLAQLAAAKGTGRRATAADVEFDRRMLGGRPAH